jgi:hypothetical protein
MYQALPRRPCHSWCSHDRTMRTRSPPLAFIWVRYSGPSYAFVGNGHANGGQPMFVGVYSDDAAADTASPRSLRPGFCATRSRNRSDLPRARPCGAGVLQQARL